MRGRKAQLVLIAGQYEIHVDGICEEKIRRDGYESMEDYLTRAEAKFDEFIQGRKEFDKKFFMPTVVKEATY